MPREKLILFHCQQVQNRTVLIRAEVWQSDKILCN